VGEQTRQAQPTAPPTLEGVTPEIAAARELVEKNPSDPDAHLQLALAYWDAKQPRSALEALTQAANLAGADNRDFFMKAGDQFKKREGWVAAAGMYLRVAQTYPVGEVPPDLMVILSEAVYKAAEQPDMPLFLFFERIDRVDQPLGFVARGRHALYTGSVDDAKFNLEQVKRIKPESYEAFLLEGEIAMKDVQPERARTIFISLSSDLGAPEWIRIMADNYLKSMP
jgi:tetratricopeptide (TPR) repeat protein